MSFLTKVTKEVLTTIKGPGTNHTNLDLIQIRLTTQPLWEGERVRSPGSYLENNLSLIGNTKPPTSQMVKLL